MLDPETFTEQEQAAKAAANPWGPRLELPADDTPAVAVDEDEDVDPSREMQLSVATIERMLAETPDRWLELLDYELKRVAPRKSALRAIIRTAKDEHGDADMIAAAELAIENLKEPPATNQDD